MTVDMPKIFFSYARADSEFVLKLAKDLRSAGINLWIDQLDIPPGDRWDSAVEKALVASPCLLVVLSPASVVSQNVMDEVALALARQKKVVPVLHRHCDIPFRIQRLQYIDFTAAYANGFTQLLTALNAAQPPQTDQVTAPPAGAGGAVAEAPRRAPRTNAKRLTYFLVGGIMVVVGITYWIYRAQLPIPFASTAPVLTYQAYRNERFRYSISYPTKLLPPKGEAADGSGQRFVSESGAFLVVTGVRGRSAADLRELFEKQSRSAPPENPTRIVTYKVKKDDWFVVSGYERQRVWYEKAMLSKDTLASFHIEYDESEKQAFDPVVEKIARSFSILPEGQ